MVSQDVSRKNLGSRCYAIQHVSASMLCYSVDQFFSLSLNCAVSKKDFTVACWLKIRVFRLEHEVVYLRPSYQCFTWSKPIEELSASNYWLYMSVKFSCSFLRILFTKKFTSISLGRLLNK